MVLDFVFLILDIAKPNGTRSTTFTKAYGSNYIIGTGSFLQTKRLDLVYEPDDKEVLPTLGLRFFTPSEIALLHGIPLKGDSCKLRYSFEFPTKINVQQQYRLLGNSLNVKVVACILNHLLNKKDE